MKEGVALVDDGAALLKEGAALFEDGAALVDDGAALVDDGVALVEENASTVDQGVPAADSRRRGTAWPLKPMRGPELRIAFFILPPHTPRLCLVSVRACAAAKAGLRVHFIMVHPEK